MIKKRLVRWLAVLCSVMVLSVPVLALAEGYHEPVKEAEITKEIEDAFDSALLVDMQTDTVLFSKDPTRVFSPTGGAVNLMSAYVVSQEAEWEQEIPVIDAVADLSSSVRNINLRSGQRWLVKDLTAGMMLYGAQDAALVLSDHVSGAQDAYVALMNQYANELGMSETVYSNALGGYQSDQKTTVSDLMLLCRAALADEQLREILKSSVYYTVNGRNIKNRMIIMDPGRSIYDERFKGIGEGSTTTSGTNMLLYLADGENELLFVGFSEKQELRKCEENGKLVLDYFIEAYTSVDVTETVKSLLEGVTIVSDDGASIEPQLQGVVSLVAPRALANEIQAGNNGSFTLGELPAVSQAPSAGDAIGNATLLYDGQNVAEISLLAATVAVTLDPQSATTPAPPTPPPVTEDPTAPQTTEAPEITPGGKEIPVYSDQDRLIREEKKSFYIVIAATILLAVIILVLVHISRRKKR